uniref:AlNc14C82G5349 protein n=1 Tax=Albugo laibachii Nc14 TaxID=890382 RepID=F0WFG0_9STRA|nr:AlNc14C82G5349 [Albugo laibachii Nc14]|eukprot:CCA19942.1 AlNc14C82G5349 [Albugo laibachii Nc14]
MKHPTFVLRSYRYLEHNLSHDSILRKTIVLFSRIDHLDASPRTLIGIKTWTWYINTVCRFNLPFTFSHRNLKLTLDGNGMIFSQRKVRAERLFHILRNGG